MFRQKNYSRNRYYRKRKQHERQIFSPLWVSIAIISIPVLLILIEVLTRLVAGFTEQSKVLATYDGKSSLERAYGLNFLNQNQEPIQGLLGGGNLKVQRNLGLSYELVSGQQNQFLHINEQGFRDHEPVPLAKPKDELRVVLLGGSTAFGYWNQNNSDTIASELETLLQERIAQQKRSPEKYQPNAWPIYWTELVKARALKPKMREGNYRVINAAVPGYSSGNELAQLALEILPYQPDLIVIVDGYADLLSPSSERATDIPQIGNFLEDARGHFHTYLDQSFQRWFNGLYSVKALNYYVLKPETSFAQKTLAIKSSSKPLEQHLPESKAELERRISRYRQNHQQIIRLCAAAKIPVIIAIQPEITGRNVKKLSEAERAIVQELGKDYQQKVSSSYTQFGQAVELLEQNFPHNVKVLNFYQLQEKLPVPAFSDAIHLTAAANSAIAGQLYETITQWQKFQIIPKESKILRYSPPKP